MREKLIELLEDICEKYAPCEMNTVADQLVANGVTIPVRCKDCKYLDMSGDDERGDCKIFDEWFTRTMDCFCPYGERRTDDQTTGKNDHGIC